MSEIKLREHSLDEQIEHCEAQIKTYGDAIGRWGNSEPPLGWIDILAVNTSILASLKALKETLVP